MPKENKINFEKRDDKDLYYALHGCKLLSPKISSDGYFEATLIDYYDFKHEEGNSFGIKINNWGYAMQEKGILENYYIYVKINMESKVIIWR